MAGWHTVPGTRWTVSELKSAYQKMVRRRDPRAFTIMDAMISSGGSDLPALLRRLPIIAMEEGMHSIIATACELAFSSTKADPVTVAQLARMVTGAMLGTPRDKDATHVMTYVKKRNGRGLTPFEQRVWEASQNLTPQTALAKVSECWRNAQAPEVREAILGLRRRLAGGVLEWDLELFTGVAMVLIEREANGTNPVIFPMEIEAAPETLPSIDTLPWYCFDPHVAVGKTVCSELARQSPQMSELRVFDIWFRLESDLIEGFVEREGWRAKLIAEEITEGDQKWWEGVRAIAQRRVEEILSKRGAVRPARTPLGIREFVADQEWIVESESIPGKTYRVRCAPLLKEWGCTCMAFEMKKSCKHILAVQEKVKA